MRASTGLGQCSAVKLVVAAGQDGVALSCDLEENHPELHWDWLQSLTWVDWTSEQEREQNPEGDYHSRPYMIAGMVAGT